MKSVILLFAFAGILILMTTSCSEDDVTPECSKTADFDFNQDESELKIDYPYREGQFITYQNEAMETLTFEVLSVDNCPVDFRIPSFFNGSTTAYTYDRQLIRMQILENDTMRYRNKAKVHYVLELRETTLRRSINFPMWNVQYANPDSEDTSNISLENNFETNLVSTIASVEINERIFENVIKIASGSSQEVSNSEYGNLSKNVNMILFAPEFGVVRFQEIDGTTWDVIYPE